MDTTPPEPPDGRCVVEYVTSNYSGKIWQVVQDPHADNGGLTDEEADAMLQEAMERQERIAEKMFGDDRSNT